MGKRRLAVSIWIWAAGLTCLSAQTPASYPLESLRVTGAERIKQEKVLALIGLKIGQPVSKTNFDAARERLLATGAFENVGYEYKPSAKKTGYDAIFELMEVLQMFPYRFEDLPAPEITLRDAIHKQEPVFEDEIPSTPGVLARIDRLLMSALDGKVKVQGRVAYSASGETTILFRPPGDVARISEAHFTGNSVLNTELLTSKFIQAAFGMPYTEAQARRLLDSSIRPLYEAKGRLRVAFPKIVAEDSKQPDITGVSLTITVDEGTEYKLGAVKLEGVEAKQVKEIETLADFKKDEMVNFDEIEKGLDRIRKRYRGNGYVHMTAKAERVLDDQKHVVNLAVKVEPGPVFTYGKLEIQGLDILNEPPIRKMWGNRDGKPFDVTSPDAFLKEIHDQQLFDNLGETKAVTKLNEDTKTADVTLIFKGGPSPDEQKKRARKRF